MLRWALGIRPGSRWQEAKVEKRAQDGFKLQAWNRKPLARPVIKVTAKDAGLKSERDVLHVQLNGPAFRVPAEFEVSWTAGNVSLKVHQSAKVRLDYSVLRPEWTGQERLLLQRCRSGGGAEIVRDNVVWMGTNVEWQATPGEYQLIVGGK
jgi:hypothetical protein